MLWDKPDCSEGESIMVYGDNFGKSTIMMQEGQFLKEKPERDNETELLGIHKS